MAEENISLADLIENFTEEMYCWILDPNSSPQTKRFLLPKMIQEQRFAYAVNVGSANDVEIVLKSPITSYEEGILVYFKAPSANTDEMTIDVDGVGPIALVDREGNALTAGDVPAGSLNVAQFDNTNFQLLVSAGGGGSSVFDGDRQIKALPSIGQTPGGTTVQEFLDNVYYPFISSTISMDAFILQEIGFLFTPTIIGTITPNDETIFNDRRVIRDPNGSNTPINNPVGNNINYVDVDIEIIEGLTQEWSIEADVDDDGNPTTISSPIRGVTGVFPFFWGMDANAALSGIDLYNALTKSISAQGDKNVTFNGSVEYIYFCYPDDYSDLTSIKDPNNFEAIGSFTQTIVSVTSVGLNTNYIKDYKVYRSNNITTVNSGLFQFIF